MKLDARSTSPLCESKSILPDPTSDIQNHKCIQIAPDEIHYILKEDETGVFVIESGVGGSDNLTIFHRSIEESESSSSSSVLLIMLLSLLAVLVYMLIIIFSSLKTLSTAYIDLNEKATLANVSLTTALF